MNSGVFANFLTLPAWELADFLDDLEDVTDLVLLALVLIWARDLKVVGVAGLEPVGEGVAGTSFFGAADLGVLAASGSESASSSGSEASM